jgi:hypothetical protein
MVSSETLTALRENLSLEFRRGAAFRLAIPFSCGMKHGGVWLELPPASQAHGVR